MGRMGYTPDFGVIESPVGNLDLNNCVALGPFSELLKKPWNIILLNPGTPRIRFSPSIICL